MKRKIVKIFLPLCIVSLITVGISYAAFHAEKKTTNVITIGNVSVNLIDIYTRADNVYPGESIAKEVFAENNGSNDEYVRIHLKKTWTDNEDNEIPELDTELIDINFPNKNDWVDGKDGYYYYQKILKPGERTSDLLDSFKLSKKYDSIKDITPEGNIIVSAEAIQSDNFQPTIDNGKIINWGDIQINDQNNDKLFSFADNRKYNANDNSKSKTKIESNVYFMKDSEEFISLPGDDLFLNFKGLKPGDEKVENINISNLNSKKIYLYMYAANTSIDEFNSEEEKDISDELLSKCTLEVSEEDQSGNIETIYNGPIQHLDSESKTFRSDTIYLGEFEKDTNAVLKAKLHIPKSWDKGNVIGKIDWIFTCEDEKIQNIVPDQPDTNIIPSDNAKVTHHTKTYDSNSILEIVFTVIMILTSFITILIGCYKRYNTSRNK